MFRLAALAAAMICAGAPAVAQPAKPPTAPTATTPAPKFTVEKSTIGEILDNPEAAAAFTKVLPEIASNPNLDQALGMTLVDASQYAPQMITAESLKKLNEEFAKIK